jgi:DNA-directed RNA polymerase specialized sigma24 family protein
MAKKFMSKQEYDDQQAKYRYSLMDPSLMAAIVDSNADNDVESEQVKEKRQLLKERLVKLILDKVKKDLTPRQQEAVRLFLMSKKQEHGATILGISQEAVNVRLKLGFKRLRKSCSEDSRVQLLLQELKVL